MALGFEMRFCSLVRFTVGALGRQVPFLPGQGRCFGCRFCGHRLCLSSLALRRSSACFGFRFRGGGGVFCSGDFNVGSLFGGLCFESCSVGFGLSCL
jgi:hypothetical protein